MIRCSMNVVIASNLARCIVARLWNFSFFQAAGTVAERTFLFNREAA